MEITIAMLVTALVIGITYTVYTIVIRSYQAYNTRHENLAVLLQLDKTLKNDFLQATGIYSDATGFKLVKKDGTIFYEIKPGYIVRNSVKSDTFKVKVPGAETRFEGNSLPQAATAAPTLADELELDIVLDKDTLNYTFHKSYSSADLINKNTDAIN